MTNTELLKAVVNGNAPDAITTKIVELVMQNNRLIEYLVKHHRENALPGILRKAKEDTESYNREKIREKLIN